MAFRSAFAYLLLSSRAVACVAAGLIAPTVAHAQAGLSVEVSPLRLELKMAAKATHTQVITLRNDGKETVTVRARVDEYWLSGDGTPQFKFAAPGTPFSAAAWIRLNPSVLTLAPGATASVRATTAVPADTPDAAYRAAVMFEFEPPEADPRAAGKDMRFRGRVAAIIYATVGAPRTAVDLVDLQVRQVPGGQPDVVAMLTNTGRGYTRTRGTMVITAEGGRKVREVAIPSVPVLPESTRELRVPTASPQDAPLEPGRYTIELRVDVGQAALLIGETTLEVARVK